MLRLQFDIFPSAARRPSRKAVSSASPDPEEDSAENLGLASVLAGVLSGINDCQGGDSDSSCSTRSHSRRQKRATAKASQIDLYLAASVRVFSGPPRTRAEAERRFHQRFVQVMKGAAGPTKSRLKTSMRRMQGQQFIEGRDYAVVISVMSAVIGNKQQLIVDAKMEQSIQQLLANVLHFMAIVYCPLKLYTLRHLRLADAFASCIHKLWAVCFDNGVLQSAQSRTRFYPATTSKLHGLLHFAWSALLHGLARPAGTPLFVKQHKRARALDRKARRRAGNQTKLSRILELQSRRRFLLSELVCSHFLANCS